MLNALLITPITLPFNTLWEDTSCPHTARQSPLHVHLLGRCSHNRAVHWRVGGWGCDSAARWTADVTFHLVLVTQLCNLWGVVTRVPLATSWWPERLCERVMTSPMYDWWKVHVVSVVVYVWVWVCTLLCVREVLYIKERESGERKKVMSAQVCLFARGTSMHVSEHAIHLFTCKCLPMFSIIPHLLPRWTNMETDPRPQQQLTHKRMSISTVSLVMSSIIHWQLLSQRHGKKYINMQSSPPREVYTGKNIKSTPYTGQALCFVRNIFLPPRARRWLSTSSRPVSHHCLSVGWLL